MGQSFGPLGVLPRSFPEARDRRKQAQGPIQENYCFPTAGLDADQRASRRPAAPGEHLPKTVRDFIRNDAAKRELLQHCERDDTRTAAAEPHGVDTWSRERVSAHAPAARPRRHDGPGTTSGGGVRTGAGAAGHDGSRSNAGRHCRSGSSPGACSRPHGSCADGAAPTGYGTAAAPAQHDAMSCGIVRTLGLFVALITPICSPYGWASCILP